MMKKIKFLVLSLSLLLSVAFFGEKCLAAAYIRNSESYSVQHNYPKCFDLNSKSTINDLSVYATAKPNNTNDIAYLTVYQNSNFTGAVTSTTKFPGGDPSVRVNFILPRNTTYYALVSTDQTVNVNGKFSAYY